MPIKSAFPLALRDSTGHSVGDIIPREWPTRPEPFEGSAPAFPVEISFPPSRLAAGAAALPGGSDQLLEWAEK